MRQIPADHRHTANTIQRAVHALGDGPLEEPALRTHIHPLFSHVLQREGIYLANHSLGRPLDQTHEDVREGLEQWYTRLGDAWDHWLHEVQDFRSQISGIIHASAPDCVVPKTSAGQGLRAVLNCYDTPLRVVTTTAEFHSIDHILHVYAQRNRIRLHCVGPDPEGHYHEDDILAAVTHPHTLVVLSLVLFTTGQYFQHLRALIQELHARESMVLLDLYHAVGAVPVDVADLNADFAIGGCYKYLRGGPGACWLYLHPRHLDGSRRSLDTGWFAQPDPFAFQRRAEPTWAEGGNAFLESTPPVLPYYQARAGLALTRLLGVRRLRAYSLRQQAQLTEQLDAHGVHVIGEPNTRGAFLAITHARASCIASQLADEGIVVDARDTILRVCPDILTTKDELEESTRRLAMTIRRHDS